MILVLASVLLVASLVVLLRGLRQTPSGTGASSTLITWAAAVLVLSLAALAATGRLHWMAAAAAAAVPFLRRGVGLLRYLPLIAGLFKPGRAGARGSRPDPRANRGQMTRDEALDVLGLEHRSGQAPDRDEIIAAHRRLIQKLHPDRGGSTYLAQQLNEAKRVLLDEV